MTKQLPADAGYERDRDEDRQQNECNRQNRPGDLRHRLLASVGDGEVWLLLDHAFDIFDDHDRIIDDDADREHKRQ